MADAAPDGGVDHRLVVGRVARSGARVHSREGRRDRLEVAQQRLLERGLLRRRHEHAQPRVLGVEGREGLPQHPRALQRHRFAPRREHEARVPDGGYREHEDDVPVHRPRFGADVANPVLVLAKDVDPYIHGLRLGLRARKSLHRVHEVPEAVLARVRDKGRGRADKGPASGVGAAKVRDARSERPVGCLGQRLVDSVAHLLRRRVDELRWMRGLKGAQARDRDAQKRPVGKRGDTVCGHHERRSGCRAHLPRLNTPAVGSRVYQHCPGEVQLRSTRHSAQANGVASLQWCRSGELRST